MKPAFTAVLLLISLVIAAQEDSVVYRTTESKINDLVHTKIELRFDYSKSWAYGKAWITLHPHLYATDSLRLDAKGMTIKEVSLVANGNKLPLKFSYDSMNLRIALNKKYIAEEQYTIYIDYIAKPNEYKAVHPSLMTGVKGLYFVNPSGAIKNMPVQIWTQSATEAGSYWFPTIDKPNQKTTQEMILTVPARYQTLSNGLMVSQKINADGTRTDTWKMDLPHAPYLFMIAVGEFAVVKDKYQGKEVNYYVEESYAPFAKKTFGHTPEMMAYFSKITGVDFPWPKYAQVVVRDYMFGAMENTSATLHGEGVQQDARDLYSGNQSEDVIAHELFHQWFGDYVTAESWSNITVNESFATYGETLWKGHKYGKEEAQQHIYNNRQAYLSQGDKTAKLVRFNYKNALDVFDLVSYQKGACILHMLRSYMGDPAFFKSLHVYLTTNKYGTAEVHQLRHAFEQVTGEDLNWFFNQWYYRPGHPVVDISYGYSNGKAMVIFKQLQKELYRLPLAVDVYEGAVAKRYQVWANNPADTFYFPANKRPELVSVDADKVLLMEKTDHLSHDNWLHLYKFAASAIDRREFAFYVAREKQMPQRVTLLQMLLADQSATIRSKTLYNAIDLGNDTILQNMETRVIEMAQKDPSASVRAGAINVLAAGKNVKKYQPLFQRATNDSAYLVASHALAALGIIDSVRSLALARAMRLKPARWPLLSTIIEQLVTYGDETDHPFIFRSFEEGSATVRGWLIENYIITLRKVKSPVELREKIDHVIAYRDNLSAFQLSILPWINQQLKEIAAKQLALGNHELAAYINARLPLSQ